MQLKSILEGALLAAGRPLTLDELGNLFEESSRPEMAQLREALDELAADCSGRGVEVCEVASGFRLQVRRELAPWIARLSEEKPARYSRALLETLALIAYRQPITRADIEEIRGVAVNPNIIRTLQERDWVRVVGHRDVPGRPELLATTRQFLDHFGLASLESLPALSEIKDFEQINPEVQLAMGESGTPRTLELPPEPESEEPEEEFEPEVLVADPFVGEDAFDAAVGDEAALDDTTAVDHHEPARQS